MTPLQLHLSGVLEPDELRRCRADAAEYMAATSGEGEGSLPEGFGKTPGGKWLNCHGWSESLEGLCRQKRLWPIVLELTVRTKPTPSEPNLHDAELSPRLFVRACATCRLRHLARDGCHPVVSRTTIMCHFQGAQQP